MSELVEVEWFGRKDKIGIVLTYDEFDGFKCRMAPLPRGYTFTNSDDNLEHIDEAQDIQWLMENAAKIPFTWALGIFGPRMTSEWAKRHLKDKTKSFILRYDRRDYQVRPQDFESGKTLALVSVDKIIEVCEDNRITQIATVKAAAEAERERLIAYEQAG